MRSVHTAGALVAGIVAAVILTTASPAVAQPAEAQAHKAYLTGGFSQKTVDRFTRDLARAGVGVYPTRSNRPLRRVRGVVSPLRIGSTQIRSAAIGAWSRNGISGATLNNLVGSVRLSSRYAIPAGAVVAGWAMRARTAKARLARRILGTPDWHHYEQVVFPDAVLMLFAADAASQIQVAAGRSRHHHRGRAATRAGAPAGPCTAVLDFVTGTINKVFDAVADVVSKRTIDKLAGTSWFGRLIGGAVNLALGPVRLAIEGARTIVLEGVKIPIKLVTNMIAGFSATVGAVGSVANAVNTWKAKILPAPDPTAKLVNEVAPGLFLLQATAAGSDLQWPDWLANCAGVFGLTLPTLTPTGATVTWNVEDQQPAGLITRGAESGPLNDRGLSQLNFATTPETPELAKGTPALGLVLAVAHVHRNDLDELIRHVADHLLGLLPSFIQKHLDAPLRRLIQPLLDKINAGIGTLQDVDAAGLLRVGYHTPEDPKKPSAIGGVWNGSWASGVYPLAGSWRGSFVQSGNSFTGTITIGGSHCVSQGTVSGQLSGDKVSFGVVSAEQHISYTGTLKGNQMSGTFDKPGKAPCGADSGTWAGSR